MQQRIAESDDGVAVHGKTLGSSEGEERKDRNCEQGKGLEMRRETGKKNTRN